MSSREEVARREAETEPDATRAWSIFLRVGSLESMLWLDWRSLLKVMPLGDPWILR